MSMNTSNEPESYFASTYTISIMLRIFFEHASMTGISCGGKDMLQFHQFIHQVRDTITTILH